MNSITSVDHKSIDSTMHETIVNAIDELYAVAYKNHIIPLNPNRKHVPSILAFSFFFFNYTEGERDFYVKTKIHFYVPNLSFTYNVHMYMCYTHRAQQI